MTVYDRIKAERSLQDAKWGVRHHSAGDWALILQEELGEAAQAIIQERHADAEGELVQAAAVIVAWLEDFKLASLQTSDKGSSERYARPVLLMEVKEYLASGWILTGEESDTHKIMLCPAAWGKPHA